MVRTGEFILETIKKDNREYAVVENPSYIFPPIEYYPLAAPLKKVNGLKAVLMDMDGTTTTTEELCIYSLEMMVRRMSGKISIDDWSGLDHNNDYPYIIGNSTTKHVEYLIKTYLNILSDNNIKTEFIKAAVWTLKLGKDKNRQLEVVQNLRKYGLTDLIQKYNDISDIQIEHFAYQLPKLGFADKVALGIDIYYEVYHEILYRLEQGKSESVRTEVFGKGKSEKNLIAPMPGIPLMIPMLKGWLGPEVIHLADQMLDDYQASHKVEFSVEERNIKKKKLVALSEYFSLNPVRLGLVTSSISYEADIVIREVFLVVGKIISNSQISKERKIIILEKLKDYHKVYDAFVTASDSSEIRLKPHRDLYSIALHKLGVSPENFDQVIGFEDSQSGTIAIRAAGIGCCIAVPFAQTSSHDLEAATNIVKGGVPEAIMKHNMFLELN